MTEPRNVLTCVFCGQQYPPGTPASQHALLYEHVWQCPKHPLSRAVALLIEARELIKRQLRKPSRFDANLLAAKIEEFLSHGQETRP